MKLTNYFELSRFWNLLIMEISRSRKGVVMALVIAFGLLFFMGLLLTPVFEPRLTEFEHYSGYRFTLLVAGFILSSLAFRDLGNPLRRYDYLTLPVSSFEKFLSMWLLTSIGWILLYTILFSVYTMFANSVGQVLFQRLTFLPFNPVSSYVLETILYYFVLQGIFLAGAVHFKSYPFPRTLLALVIFATVCGVITYFIMRNYFNVELGNESDLFRGMATERLWKVIQWMFWWLLAPLSWVVTYLGLKEQEV